MSQALRDARRYEEGLEDNIPAEERPAFHLGARVGWMNDPNGFSYYYGKYHMFYQYHPYDSHWGPMHWGHAVSKDLLHWEYMPVAIAPDRPYDRDGCYSGSAITMPDGRHMLMYTGIAFEGDEYSGKRDVQTQNLAFGNGIDYEKYKGNPVIDEKLLPEGGDKYRFRDPKIWQRADGTYRALVANFNEKGGGQMLLFASDNAIDWRFVKTFASNDDRIGVMWECPDFFMLDGKAVLLASAQDMLPDAEKGYYNGNGGFYLIGSYDDETETFTKEGDYALDYGMDFYAPQTVVTPDGRRVMIAWMQNWDTCNLRTASTPWYGQMSLPRELSVVDGRLYQNPIREFVELHGTKTEYYDVVVADDEISLPGINGRLIDMELTVEAADAEDIYQKFAVRFARNEQFHTALSYRPLEGKLKIDRQFSGSRRAIIHQRRATVPSENGRIKLRIIMDRFSVEIFINDGEKTMSATIYTDMSAKGISFFANGKAKINVVKYDLSV